jgi:UDP-N-acetylglucosamine:LPS N-acetylglucosamine transferase
MYEGRGMSGVVSRLRETGLRRVPIRPLRRPRRATRTESGGNAGRPRALILTAKTGGGHLSLADAIRDQISSEYECSIQDPQPAIMHQHYRAVSRYALWLWAAEYRVTNTPERALQAQRFYARLMAQNLRILFDHARPDIIISTYPFLTYSVMRVLRRWGWHIPFIILFTDPKDLHAAWMIEKGADMTWAPTRETHAQALAAGFNAERLRMIGWPVRGQFYRAGGQDRAAFLRKIGLDPAKFTVFLQGGGEGSAQFGRTVKHVLEAGKNVQIILACGTNELLKVRYNHTPNVRTLAFTKEIAPYMAAADVVMGKAGPNMLFETVTLGKPFIATTYIPGQEECNLQLINHYGLGWVAQEPERQGELIHDLVSSRGKLAAMSASVEEYRAWNTRANSTILPIVRALAPSSGALEASKS